MACARLLKFMNWPMAHGLGEFLLPVTSCNARETRLKVNGAISVKYRKCPQ